MVPMILWAQQGLTYAEGGLPSPELLTSTIFLLYPPIWGVIYAAPL